MTDRTPAQVIADVGEAMFPGFWIAELSRRLPCSLRTLERIAAAARGGADYPAARKLLADLHRVTTEERERMDVLLDAIEDAQAGLAQPTA